MRKMILLMALASVAMPALAEPGDREAWAERRAARTDERQERSAEPARAQPQRAEPSRFEPPRVEPPRVDQPRVDQPRLDMGRRADRDARGGWQGSAPDAPRSEIPRDAGNAGALSRPDGAAPITRRPPNPADVARWRERMEQRANPDGRDPGDGRTAPGRATRWSDHVRSPGASAGGLTPPGGVRPSDPPAAWTGQPDGDHRTDLNRDGQRWSDHHPHDGQHWSNDWRRDPRYDWQRYRDRNRLVFRIGNYSDPFGWEYRRPTIGITLYAGYYQPDYWLDDPWQYRLPPVYGPYRWVRYYDDAVLVDIYSGRIVDVIRNFFW